MAVRLLASMMRIRAVEERIAELYTEQEMRCPVHLCIGQEGIAAGVCAALSRDDAVVSGHRSHGHYLAKGGDLKTMFAELYGKATGCSGGKGGSMHLVDLESGFLGATPIVGSTIAIGVGAAFAFALRGEPRVAVAFFGEGATEEGVFSESLNFAALQKLPVIFVCENNLYSVYSPLSVRQPQGRSVTGIAASHGIESRQGDGNDACQVYEYAAKAVAKARAGEGPAFLEFSTYRWREHCGPFYDNDLGYRTPAEFERWRAERPIERLSARLLACRQATGAQIAAIKRAIDHDIAEAVAFAKASPFPRSEKLMEHVYAA